MKDIEIEPRMYRETKEAVGEKTVKEGFVVKKKTNKVAYGVDTNNVTRKQMFDMLPELVETEYDKFVSPNVFKDLSTLERKKTGKIEHSTSGHDDSLMAYLIFRWAVFYGKCFRDKFGINPVPSRMNVRVVSNSADLAKFQNIIQMANNEAERVAELQNSMAYSFLQQQEQNLKRDQNEQVNAFMRIANFNKDY